MTTKIRFEVLAAVKDGKDFNKVCDMMKARLEKVNGVIEAKILVAVGGMSDD